MVKKAKKDISVMRRLARQRWGHINHQKKIADGVYWFDCAGHGGYVVDIEKYPKAEEYQETVYIRRDSSKYYVDEQKFAIFEEDCAWAILEYWYHEIMEKANKKFDYVNDDFTLEDRRRAVISCLYRWYPEKLSEEDLNEVEDKKEKELV